jgi:hypothetical protein
MKEFVSGLCSKDTHLGCPALVGKKCDAVLVEKLLLWFMSLWHWEALQATAICQDKAAP